jgi:uncharacterized membrane protein YjgN (DUF898 family)
MDTPQENAVPTAPNPAPSTQTLDIRFTASGSEYFRIWIVNLLLTLVTLTLYLPFARARKTTYFQNNTLVGGHALGFHADPWKMFRGYLVALGLGLGYWAVSKFAPAFAWVALLVLLAVWPALWRASLQFRLRNTSWRGVRMDFAGDMLGAYLALLPFFIPALAIVPFLPELEAMETEGDLPSGNISAIIGFTVLGFILLAPWLMARLKRYQQGGYMFAQERTQLKASTWSFYLLNIKTAVVYLVVSSGALIGLLLLVILGVVIAMGTGASLQMMDIEFLQDYFSSTTGIVLIGVFVLLVIFMFYGLVPLFSAAYYQSRSQNLIWRHTASQRIQFNSQLTYNATLKTMAANWALIVITLGLYWPFAQVNMTRLRLQSMGMQVEGDVDQWVGSAQQHQQNVLGDAAGDFFGIDMGL